MAEFAANWISVVQGQQQRIQALTMRIETLENQLSKNRSNQRSKPVHSADRCAKGHCQPGGASQCNTDRR